MKTNNLVEAAYQKDIQAFMEEFNALFEKCLSQKLEQVKDDTLSEMGFKHKKNHRCHDKDDEWTDRLSEEDDLDDCDLDEEEDYDDLDEEEDYDDLDEEDDLDDLDEEDDLDDLDEEDDLDDCDLDEEDDCDDLDEEEDCDRSSHKAKHAGSAHSRVQRLRRLMHRSHHRMH